MFIKLSKLLILCAITTLFSQTHLWASEAHQHSSKTKTEGTQLVCPISKKAVDAKSFIKYQGQKIYFCCQGCDKKFLKDPEYHFKQMKDRKENAESIQKFCPVSGDLLEDREVSVDLPGRKIYFCCKKCVKSFNKDRQKYLSKMNDQKSKNKKDAKKHHGHDHSGHQH